MHGEELVVLVSGKEMRFWKRQLETHRSGKQSGDEKETKGRHYISDADGRMVDRLKPTNENP